MGEASGASLPLRLAIANAPWARADHRRFPWRPTRAGRWTAIDNCTCKCLGLIADSSLLSRRVARELVAIVLRRERPGTIISDNGTEYTSNAIQAEDTGLLVPPRRTASTRASTTVPATDC